MADNSSMWKDFSNSAGTMVNSPLDAMKRWGSTAYKAAVPVNARTLIDTVRGVRDPITEADLSPEELRVLGQIHQTTQAKNVQHKQAIALEISKPLDAYAKNPETELVDIGNGKYESRPLSYDAYQAQKKKQFDSYDRTANRTAISYNDYPDQMAAPTFDSPMASIWKSFTDPAYRMKTLVGSAVVHDTPEGPQLRDSYNFDSRDFYNSQYGKGKTLEQRSDWEILKGANGFVDGIDQMMIKHLPGASRDVRINLPKDGKYK